MSAHSSNPAQLRADKALWIEQATHRLMAQYHETPVFAELAACWASFWLDDFKILYAKRPTESRSDQILLVRRALASSEQRAKCLPQFPYGMPMHRVKIMATTAFCSAFPEEQQLYIMEMLRKAN